MLVTYKHLKDGYILKDGDTLNIYGCKSTVIASRIGCHLSDIRGVTYNDWLFLNLYGMSEAQKDGWAAKYGGQPGCFFPMIPTLNLLTDFVIDIYETSPFKVGDTVRIKKREYPSCDYPLSFVEKMTELTGKTTTIKAVGIITICDPFTYENEGGGDIHYYKFDGIPYNWTSNMFELVKRADEVPSRKESNLAKGEILAMQLAMQGTPATPRVTRVIMSPRSHSSHLSHFLFEGALGEQGTTPVSELKKDRIPEGEDVTIRPPKYRSTIFKI